MTWEDLQAWCDELSAWIVELGEEKELEVAFPKGKFPLVADPELDDLEEDRDVLAYLTLWMCCKRGIQAPPGLHARMFLSAPFKGPWQKLYADLVNRLALKMDYKDIDIFSLAG